MDILKGLSNSVLDKIFQYGLTSLQCQRIVTKETDYIGIPLTDGSITNSDGTPEVKKQPGTDKIENSDKLSRRKFQRISSGEIQDKFSHHVMRVVDIVHYKKRAHNDSDCYSNVSCAGDVLVAPDQCEGHAALNRIKVKVERTDNMNGDTNTADRVALKATSSNEKPIEVKYRTMTHCTDILDCNTNVDRCVVKLEPNDTVVTKDITMNDASKQTSDGSVFNTEFGIFNIKTENIEQEDENSMCISKLQISKVYSKSQIVQPNVTVGKSNQTCCVSKDDKQIIQQATNNIIPNVHTKDAVIIDNNKKSTEHQPMYDQVPDCMNKLQSHSDKNEIGYRNIPSMQAEVYIDVDLDGNNNCVNDNFVINDILKYKHTPPVTAYCTDIQEQHNLDDSEIPCLSFASEESSDSFLEEPVKFLNTGTLKNCGKRKSEITIGKTQQIVNNQNSNGNNVIGIKKTQSTNKTTPNMKLMNARVILRKCDADIQNMNLQKAIHRCEKDAKYFNTPIIRRKSFEIESVSSNDKEKENKKCESTSKKNMDPADNAKMCSVKKSKHLDKREECKRNESRKYKSMSDKNGKSSSSVKKTSDLYMEDSDEEVKANKTETSKANVKSNEKESTGHRISEKNDDEHAIKYMPAVKTLQKGVKHKNGSLKGIVKKISDNQDSRNTNTDNVTFIEKGLSVNENKDENSKPPIDTNKGNLAVKLTTKTQNVLKDSLPEVDDNKGIRTHRIDKPVCFNENNRVNGKCKGHGRDKEACSNFSKTRKRSHSSDEGLIHRNHKQINRISDEINDKKKERKGRSNEKHTGNKKAVVICNEHKKMKTKPPQPNTLNSDTRERILEWLAAGVEMEHGQSYCANDTKKKSLQNKIDFKIPKKDRNVKRGNSDTEISLKDAARVNITDGKKPKQSDKKHHLCKNIENESKVGEAKEKRIHPSELRISKNNESKHTINVSTNETTAGVNLVGQMNEDKLLEEETNTNATCLTKHPQQNPVYMKFDRKFSSICGFSKETVVKGSEIKTSNRASAEKVHKRHRQESENMDKKTMTANKRAKCTNESLCRRSLDKNEGKIMSVTRSSGKSDKTVDISCEKKCRDMRHTSSFMTNSVTYTDKDSKTSKLVIPNEFDNHKDQTEGDECTDINNNQKHVFNDNEKMNDSEAIVFEKEQTAMKRLVHGKDTNNYGVNDKPIENTQNVHCMIGDRNKYQRMHPCITCKKTFCLCLEALKKHKVKCISTENRADRELNFNEMKTDGDCNTNSPNINKVPVGCEEESRKIRRLKGSSSTVFRSRSLKECKNDSRNMNLGGKTGKENIEISVNITNQREHIQMNNQSVTNYIPKVKNSSGGMVRCEHCKKAWYSNKYDFKCHQKRCDALKTTKDCAHKSKRDNSNWVRQYPMALKSVSTATYISSKNVNHAEVKNMKATFVSSVVRQIGPEIQNRNTFDDRHRNCNVLATVKRTEMCRICKGAYFRSRKDLFRHVKICKHKMKLEANKWRS